MNVAARSLVALMALGIAFAAYAENGGGVSITPDVVYGHKDGMALTFDVLTPAEANGAGILFMVSGGWVSRWSPPEQAVGRFVSLLDRGFTVFAVRHGSSPRYKVPDAYGDVDRAVRFIRLNAERFGVDANRLGVFGGSAGGHLSLMLGATGDDGKADASDEVLRTPSRVAAVVAYFPPVDLRPIVGPSERFPALDFDRSEAANVSPILHVTESNPPTLLVHGTNDTLVPLRNSEEIHKVFQEKKVKSELIVLEGAGHGFQGEHADQATAALVNWFEDHLVNSGN